MMENKKITPEEREVLHKLLDKMCDDGEPNLMWEWYFHGDEPFTFVRKRIWLSMGISENTEMR